MAIRVVCPFCAAKLRAPDRKAGRKTKCPVCSASVQVPGLEPQESSDVELVAIETMQALPAARKFLTCPHCRGTITVVEQFAGQVFTCPHCQGQVQVSRQPETAISAVPVTNQAQAPAWDQLERPADEPLPRRYRRDGEHRGTSGIGVTSLVLGVVSFVVALVPCMGILALPLIVIGLLLGGIGFIVGLIRDGRGVGYSIGGLAANGTALLLVLFWLGGIRGFVEGVDKLKKAAVKVPQQEKAGAKGTGKAVEPEPSKALGKTPGQTGPQSKPSQEQKEFDHRLGDFIKEGRSVARMLDLVPDLVPYNKRVDALTELFTRIPDAANEQQTAYKKFGQRVLATLGLGSVFIKLRNDFLRLKTEDEAKKCDQHCKELGEKVRYYFGELESSVRDSRFPLSLEELDKKHKK